MTILLVKMSGLIRHFPLIISLRRFMEALGAKGDIALVDLSQYLLLKKGSAKQDWSMHVEFLTDQMCFRMVLRCNGAPKVNAPLKIKNSTLTRSPFVTLAARA